MHLSTEIRKRLIDTIVPVRCGGNCGTAFFVGKQNLLTARHVVADYFINGSTIFIVYDGASYLCTAKEIGEGLDVIIMECAECSSIAALSLLSARFDAESSLLIAGYPKELGHCADLITIGVRNKVEVEGRDYDVLVSREDSLGLHSYSGFSGSPIINEKGSVIGVVSDNVAMTLGYVSINKLSNILRDKGINFSKDYESEDMTQYGQGRSQKLLEEAIVRAGGRYSPEIHQSCPIFEEQFLSFASKKRNDENKRLLRSFEDWLLSTERSFARERPEYNRGNYEKLYDFIESINISKLEKEENDKLEELQDKYISAMYSVETYKKHFCVIRGHAGCGKTHLTCHLAKKLSKEANVYLMFGNQFSSDDDLMDYIGTLNGFSDKDWPTKLKEHIEVSQGKALFIIDGLNEGPSEGYWKNGIEALVNGVKDIECIKMIFTVRNDAESVNIKTRLYGNLWTEDIMLEGFEDIDAAIKEYFKKERIVDSNGEIKRYFKNDCRLPLFLKILCQAIRIVGETQIILEKRINIYLYYLLQRNREVSNKVDEDEFKDITRAFLLRIAKYALFYRRCQPIERQKARLYADQICRYRPWSQNLLNVCLKENLLMPTGHGGNNIMFEYEKLGNYLETYCLENSKMTDKQKISFLKDGLLKSQDFYFRNFATVFLSAWDIPEQMLNDGSFNDEPLKSCLLYSLEQRKNKRKGIIKWMTENKCLSPKILMEHIDWFSLVEMERFNDSLMEMDFHTREMTWTTAVNDMYSFSKGWSWKPVAQIKPENIEDAKKSSILLSWLCCSSHPIIRFTVMRKLTELFISFKLDLASFVIDKINECNDSYVLQIVYAALYGYTLRIQDSNIVEEIANRIFDCNYKDEVNIPNDIIIRQWTLSILQRAACLSSKSKFFSSIRPPFHKKWADEMFKDKTVDEHYFGNEDGGHLLYYSLFSFEDFNRYVLGSNNGNKSKDFFTEENKQCHPVPLSNIRIYMSNLIKHKYKWGDDIAKFDNGKYSTNREENKTERIGKKYQWMALYEVAAYLSDEMLMCDEAKYVYDPNMGDAVSIPYPWYFSAHWLIDPSMTANENVQGIIIKLDKYPDYSSLQDDEWLSNDNILPKVMLVFNDSAGNSWIVLTCYDLNKERQRNGKIRNLFLLSNAAFVKNNDIKRLWTWAEKQNFYGRWMPESRGLYNFLWNEYPWADSFKRLKIKNFEDNLPKSCPCPMNLSYLAQLQEEYEGLEGHDKILSSVYMPNVDLMNYLKLYTAERGILRMKDDDSIAAGNFEYEGMFGLAIRKDLLDGFMQSHDVTLFYYLAGEKEIINKGFQLCTPRQQLSGAYLYNGQFEDIQKLHVDKTKESI